MLMTRDWTISIQQSQKAVSFILRAVTMTMIMIITMIITMTTATTKKQQHL